LQANKERVGQQFGGTVELAVKSDEEVRHRQRMLRNQVRKDVLPRGPIRFPERKPPREPAFESVGLIGLDGRGIARMLGVWYVIEQEIVLAEALDLTVLAKQKTQQSRSCTERPA
jgi:hypothetical protein